MMRDVELWEMLVWAYQAQQVHRYLRRPMQWFLWAIEEAELVEDAGSPPVHFDAAALHALVLELDREQAELITSHAALGMQPESSVIQPIPSYVSPDRSKWLDVGERIARAKCHGVRIEYLVRTVEPEVEYCPLAWDIEPDYVISAIETYRAWVEAMTALYGLISSGCFRGHRVIGRGIDGLAAQAPEEIQDARTVMLDDAFPRRKVADDRDNGGLDALRLMPDGGLCVAVRRVKIIDRKNRI